MERSLVSERSQSPPAHRRRIDHSCLPRPINQSEQKRLNSESRQQRRLLTKQNTTVASREQNALQHRNARDAQDEVTIIAIREENALQHRNVREAQDEESTLAIREQDALQHRNARDAQDEDKTRVAKVANASQHRLEREAQLARMIAQESVSEIAPEQDESDEQREQQVAQIVMGASMQVAELLPDQLNARQRAKQRLRREEAVAHAGRTHQRYQRHLRCARQADLDNFVENFVQIRHSCGEFQKRCSHCGAFMWIGERISNSSISRPQFGEACCLSGSIRIPLIPEPPQLLHQLLTEQTPRGLNFRLHIRKYNSAMAMATMGATEQVIPVSGLQSYRVHGTVSRLIGPFHPNEGNAPRAYQSYFYDPELSTQHQMHAMPTYAACDVSASHPPAKRDAPAEQPLSAIFPGCT